MKYEGRIDAMLLLLIPSSFSSSSPLKLLVSSFIPFSLIIREAELFYLHPGSILSFVVIIHQIIRSENKEGRKNGLQIH